MRRFLMAVLILFGALSLVFAFQNCSKTHESSSWSSAEEASEINPYALELGKGNLLPFGDFESGTEDLGFGVADSQGAVIAAPVDAIAAAAHSGAKGLRLTGTWWAFWPDYLNETHLIPKYNRGKNYRLSFWARYVSYDPLYPQVPYLDYYLVATADPPVASMHVGFSINKPEWTYYEHVFTFPDDGNDWKTYMDVSSMTRTTNILDIDDLKLEETTDVPSATPSVVNYAATPAVGIPATK